MVAPTASLKEFPYRNSNIYICLYTLSEKRITEFILHMDISKRYTTVCV